MHRKHCDVAEDSLTVWHSNILEVRRRETQGVIYKLLGEYLAVIIWKCTRPASIACIVIDSNIGEICTEDGFQHQNKTILAVPIPECYVATATRVHRKEPGRQCVRGLTESIPS
jgi:hypothetical protein